MNYFVVAIATMVFHALNLLPAVYVCCYCFGVVGVGFIVVIFIVVVVIKARLFACALLNVLTEKS